MRLNSRREIAIYIGRNPRNKRTWRRLRARYADVIFCDPHTGHVWADSVDLDAIDRRLCITMVDFLSRRPKGDPAGGHGGSLPPWWKRQQEKLFSPVPGEEEG